MCTVDLPCKEHLYVYMAKCIYDESMWKSRMGQVKSEGKCQVSFDFFIILYWTSSGFKLTLIFSS